MTQHTVDTLMALAYKIRDARTYEWDVSEAVEAGNALHKALTEALAPKSHNTNSLRQDDGRCGLCGGDWSVCGCQGMVNRKSLPQAAQPVREQEMYKIVNFQCQCGKVHGFPEAMIATQPAQEPVATVRRELHPWEKALLGPPHPKDFGIPKGHWEAAQYYANFWHQTQATTTKSHPTLQIH